MSAIIQVAGGTYIDLLDPRPEDIRLSDIAASLSKLCRFTGHVSSFYSVAQHSVYASWAGKSAQDSINLLLHDAHEAYVGDLNSPLKALCPDYQKIEADIDKVIRNKFNLAPAMTDHHRLVDLRMLVTEVKDLMVDKNPPWACLDDPEATRMPWLIQPWSPERAEEMFLNAFKTYEQRIADELRGTAA